MTLHLRACETKPKRAVRQARHPARLRPDDPNLQGLQADTKDGRKRKGKVWKKKAGMSAGSGSWNTSKQVLPGATLRRCKPTEATKAMREKAHPTPNRNFSSLSEQQL